MRQFSRTTAWEWAKKLIADLDAAIDDCVREKYGVVPDLNVLVDDDVRTDMSVASNLRGFMDDCCGMNSGSVTQGLMEKFEGAGEAVIRIFDAQRCGGNSGKIFGDDYGCGFGEPGGWRVLLVRDEGEFGRAGLLDAVEAGDLFIDKLDTEGAVIEARVEGGGDLGKFHGDGCGCE